MCRLYLSNHSVSCSSVCHVADCSVSVYTVSELTVLITKNSQKSYILLYHILRCNCSDH